MSNGSEMIKMAGCIPFGDHKVGVDTNSFKSIRDVLRKAVPVKVRS